MDYRKLSMLHKAATNVKMGIGYITMPERVIIYLFLFKRYTYTLAFLDVA